MRRRHFVERTFGAAVAWLLALGTLAPPLSATAQQTAAVRRIGYITGPRTPLTDSFWEAFVAGLQEHGWIEPGTS